MTPTNAVLHWTEYPPPAALQTFAPSAAGQMLPVGSGAPVQLVVDEADDVVDEADDVVDEYPAVYDV